MASTPDEFFPVNVQMRRGLEAARRFVENEADAKGMTGKALRDHVYKYGRVKYFRDRDPRANRPPYSGFETLVFLSTGLVRNLLEPCFWMYDAAKSEQDAGGGATPITEIAPPIQTKEILKLSERKWDWLERNIARDIEGCSTEQGEQVHRLMDALAMLFRERLLHHKSEPSALSFTISGKDSVVMSALEELVSILRKGELLYVRSGPAKDRGRRERYYEPNRILWPARALDPHGQHARVSISAEVLLAASRGSNILEPGVSSLSLWEDE